MDVYQLLKKLNGEIVSNKAIVIIDGEPVEVGGIVDNEFKLNEKGLELAEANQDSKPEKRIRARNTDGTLKADDPSTPDINEAWEDGDI
tara:strand:- start:371 stop:637 length:267 start_codon:yes stop_codon:yes gene_type:complete